MWPLPQEHLLWKGSQFVYTMLQDTVLPYEHTKIHHSDDFLHSLFYQTICIHVMTACVWYKCLNMLILPYCHCCEYLSMNPIQSSNKHFFSVYNVVSMIYHTIHPLFPRHFLSVCHYPVCKLSKMSGFCFVLLLYSHLLKLMTEMQAGIVHNCPAAL